MILLLHALINIYSSHLVALFNNISVFWHVFGVIVIIAILIFVPDRTRAPTSSSRRGSTTPASRTEPRRPLLLGLRAARRLPADDVHVTGYDASAHVAEETQGAEMAAAKGVWQSVALSALIGWFVLLAITFAATDVKGSTTPAG